MDQLLRLALVLLPCLLGLYSPVEARGTSFSIDLIHRDSPLSPFYNPSLTPSELLSKAAYLSVNRIDYFRSFIDNKIIQSAVVPFSGAYLMEISIGTPSTQFLAVADTGSDLIWIQCSPCPRPRCYNQTTPLFSPQRSSTYSTISCNSGFCLAIRRHRCSSSNTCEYQVLYGDQPSSSTMGVLSDDTFSFESTTGESVAFPASVFGCGYDNEGAFPKNGPSAGIVGLGGGPLSLVSQLGAQIDHKFSYCLVPFSTSSTSKLKFGQAAIISGPTVVSTPLVTKSPPTFYYLTLNGISLGGKTTQLLQSEGNIIIDSGTTLTILDSDSYDNLKTIVEDAIGVEPVSSGTQDLDLCYEAAAAAGAITTLPDMVFHFAGADLHLNYERTFVKNGDLICLAMIPGELSIFGNVAQVNFLVAYDLQKKQVSFAPADCTQQ